MLCRGLSKKNISTILEHFVREGFLQLAYELMMKHSIDHPRKEEIHTLINLTPEETREAHLIIKNYEILKKHIFFFFQKRCWDVLIHIFKNSNVLLSSYSTPAVYEMVMDDDLDNAWKIIELVKTANFMDEVDFITKTITFSLIFSSEASFTKCFCLFKERLPDRSFSVLKTSIECEKYKKRAYNIMFQTGGFYAMKPFISLSRKICH